MPIPYEAVIYLRCSTEERDTIKKLAAANNLSVTQFCLQNLLDNDGAGMQYRLYQYQTDPISRQERNARMVGLEMVPLCGMWVIQKRMGLGGWKNIEGPYLEKDRVKAEARLSELLTGIPQRKKEFA